MYKRVIMYIDSSNFYFHSKHLMKCDSLKYNWAGLVQMILKKCMENESCEFERAYYYTGMPDPRIDNASYQKQKKFLNAIRSIHFIKVKTGYILKNAATGNHSEKGIDVMLASDLLMDAAEDEYDTAILVSGDGDFKYCIDKVKQFGKEVIVCVPMGVTCEALKQSANKIVHVTREELNPYINNN